MIERATVTEDVSTRVVQTMQRFPTYTLSAVTLRMSMTSHSPEVIGVALPCMNELEKCHRKKKCMRDTVMTGKTHENGVALDCLCLPTATT